MIRQYGMGYVFVDQSASLLSKVAFANSYATIALNQKLKSDIQSLSSAMNLTDEQKQALNTLPVGTAVVRLADEFPEPFLVKIPFFPIQEGLVSDEYIQKRRATFYRDSSVNRSFEKVPRAISPVPSSDKDSKRNAHHPSKQKT